MAKAIKVLHIEDSLVAQGIVQACLEKSGDVPFELVQADRLAEAQKILGKQTFDVVLLDLHLPDKSGKELYDAIHRQVPRTPIVILSGNFEEKAAAIQRLKGGAQDFLLKDNLQEEILVRSLLYAIERKKLEVFKDDFIGTVSHELRTPLTVIGLGLENLQAGILGSLNEKQAEAIERNIRNAKRLGKLIDNLLDLSRLESGQTKLEGKEVDLKHLIHEVIQNFQPAGKEGGASIQEEVAANLPHLECDPDLIAQVLTNLLSNAIRYAQGRIVVKATVIHGDGGTPQFIQTSVGNDGPGIPQEKLDELFKKFVQLDRANRKTSYKGTGLGLAISKEIIERHKGKIWVESPEEAGVTFHFTLPIQTDGD